MASVKEQVTTLDAVVIGAGFSGLYMLYRLREAGLKTRVYEAAGGVGGVWYWNRYPGARCDSESIYYNYTFSEELYKEWTWTSKYPEQPEILRYLNFVADKFELRPDIQFHTRIEKAEYNERTNRWQLETKNGEKISAKYFITGIGCISTANIPKFKGLESFEGDWYHTGHWPHEKVDFTGKRVGIIGTGSSGVQAIPVIAKEADHLTVFQRTPQYSVPARNYPYSEEEVVQAKASFQEMRKTVRDSLAGLPVSYGEKSVLDDSPEERQKTLEKAWEIGGTTLLFAYKDVITDERANEIVSAFIRSKIKETVEDSKTAEQLTPDYYYGTKRPIIDTDYFETYNRSNVSLVDVKKAPIEEITPKGIRTADGEYELDVIVFATGYDGMTGSLFKMDIVGKEGVCLKDKWENGAAIRTYLGMSTTGFPNMFMITGPESPSVLGNMPITIEQHVEWISDCIDYLRKHDIETIEAKEDAEQAWSKHCRELADTTLYTKTDSWYTGANIEDKVRGFPIYVGGYGPYHEKCAEVAEQGYDGFTLMSNTVV
ncbi:Predicted flavoprotein CzcO associated with the cation diffusion facilitator CzcD [Alteribacillus persepolensis]|uniref:Predicted flavoprotein CzcO associated with the cation diffusion facilitator CzcD n=1 Tax=Alteribacillus persepolensis TaxID=568899 RepID=A0A1G8H257_9BACI|nr:NAD(P)/FAD-dependent oxidoreductase [Alteribacillus persepolensis]SDI00717.1 Predicted flavoprotein CzcO associated with the cation diffusion facilitator CzcD [Alteribacillus persepolensis]